MPAVIEGLFYDLLDKYDPGFRSAARDMLANDISRLMPLAEAEEAYLDGLYGIANDPDDPDFGRVGNEMIHWWMTHLTPIVRELRAGWLTTYPADETDAEKAEKLAEENLRLRARCDQRDAKLRRERLRVVQLQEELDRSAADVQLLRETVMALQEARRCPQCDGPLY